jgi:hypothetical protein
MISIREEIRVRFGRGRPPVAARYVRKQRVAPRVAAYGGRHRASVIRPAYSAPSRVIRPVRRAVYVVTRAVRPSARPVTPRLLARRSGVRVREAAPARSSVNVTIRAWLADQGHGARTHRARPRRRDHVYLPSIGWCWDTGQFATI